MATNEEVRARIAQTNDIGELLRIYRGFYNTNLREFAHDTNALAGDKLAELTGLDRNGISSMHDAEIVQAYQGKQEQKKITDLAEQQQGKINQFADEFSGSAKTYHDRLAQSLAKNNQEAFQLENPYILEDLNKRGLFRSPTAVAGAQTDAMKELELQRQNSLINFDSSAFGQEQDIRGGGLSNLIGGQNAGLDAALNARRSGLEQAYGQINSQNQESLAQALARRKSRDSLYSSLIQAGGQAGGAALTAGLA